MMRAIVALIAVVTMINANAMIQETSFTHSKKKSLNECLYEFHKLQNELNGILYFGYTEQGEIGLAKEALDSVELYPEEEDEFERFMNKLKNGYDMSNDASYFLNKAYKKDLELNRKAKECERLQK